MQPIVCMWLMLLASLIISDIELFHLSARALNSWLLWLSNTLPVLILSILLLVRLGLCHQIGWSLLGFHSSAFLAHQVSAAEFLELLGLTWRTQIQLYGQSVRYCIDIEALSFLEADWRAPLTDQLHRRSLLSTWLGEIFFLINQGIPLSLAGAIRELDFFAQINGVTLTISSFLWAMCLKVSTKYLTPLAGSVTFSCFGFREFGGLQPRSWEEP
jgi:hypothetical protein